MDKRFQVFVSSTYADLKQERQKVIQALMEIDCIPAGMELFPAADEEQWEFIKRVIDDCDYYILIIGGRYGSLTNEGISYTEKEYDYAISIGLKVLAFLHEQPDEIAVGKSDINPTLREKLEKFREKVAKNRIVKFWRDATDLPSLVALSLLKTIKTYPAVGWIRTSNVASSELLVDLKDIKQENSQLKTTVAKLKSQLVPENSTLASLDDTFSVLLKWKVYSSTHGRSNRRERTETVTVTWRETFARIAPDLQEYPSDTKVNSILGTSLYRKDHPSSDTLVRVQHDDFQTIRVQLSALGLIDTNYQKTTKGGMALFWSLTPSGQQLMRQLRTVKAVTVEKTG